jgi:hypothetical protein
LNDLTLASSSERTRPRYGEAANMRDDAAWASELLFLRYFSAASSRRSVPFRAMENLHDLAEHQ